MAKHQRQGNKRRTGHIVSHTHWDREWRYPIWETRLMLVDFLDELIELLERGAYPGFLLDGQCSPVRDYLEVRPENRERVKALMASGKLAIGPWYFLPDEYPVDGESMVRNLLWGRRLSEELGGVMNIGYTPFGWGQTAQLPQIYAGFAMEVALVGKRVNKQRAPKSEFVWRAPDGSELLATRFGELGRQNFYFHIHLSALFGFNHFGPQWRYLWETGGIAYHRADEEQMEQDHFRLDAPAGWHPEYITPEVIEETWETTDESVLEGDRLMMNGCDYTAAQPRFPEMLARINEVDPAPDREWIHTTLPEFVEQVMKKKIDRSELQVVHGELRDGPAGHVTGNALATRLYLKRLNKRAQNLLIRFAEPLTIAAAMAGVSYPGVFVRTAWDHLLASHPHDSINGVTQDKTAQDVAGRLHQVIDLSQSLGNRAMQELIRRIDLSGFADEDVLIVVFNPWPHRRRELVKAYVNMPLQAVADEIVMLDAEGNVLDTQWQGKTRERYTVAELHTRAFPYDCDRHLLYFDTGELPAGGYKVFRAATRAPMEASWSAGGRIQTGTLLKAPNILENDYLRVVMNPNGTFDLTDRERNRTYAGLNYYEDRGEHGDYWINRRPMFDQVHTSLGSAARIWSEQSGPLQATLVSEVAMRLPAGGIKEQQRRGDALVDLVLKTAVTLRAGQGFVEINLEFENRCQDHYLRAMFPTGLRNATHADAGGHFTVDRRPIRPQGPSPDTYWLEMATLPQNNFVDVSDGEVGIAFLNDSLTEYEVVDSDERVVALSLLRCVRNWVCTETRVGSGWPSQKGGQALGVHKIRYALYPHAGNWEDANVPAQAERFNVGVIPVQTRTSPGKLPAAQASLYAIDNEKLRFAALKKAEDRATFVVRIYNPTGSEQKGNLKFAASLSKAWLTNLNEQRAGEIKLADAHTVPVTAGPHKIVTVEIEQSR